MITRNHREVANVNFQLCQQGFDDLSRAIEVGILFGVPYEITRDYDRVDLFTSNRKKQVAMTPHRRS